MKKLSIFCLVLAMASPACAQQIMDGTGKALDPTLPSKIAMALADVANDPFSAQLIQLHPSGASDKVICGYVNLKNASGGYTGFKPFYFGLDTNTISMETSSGC